MPSAYDARESNLFRYETFLNECNVPFKWMTTQNVKGIQWRDLTGPEKLRIFKAINISELFPDLSNNTIICKLWKDFLLMTQQMTDPNTVPEDFMANAQSWVTLYLSIYQTKNVTHAFAMHVWEFLKLYGSLEPFSQQALEKLNDLTTLHYLRETNHHHKDDEALRQLILKRNRIERMEDERAKRMKRPCTCSNCGEKGHNKRSCTSAAV